MQDTKHKVKALDKSNCAAVRLGGKEAGVKTASPRTETCCEAGDTDKLAPHNGVRDSVSQVKHGVVPGRFTPLLGEACPTSAARRARSAYRDARFAWPHVVQSVLPLYAGTY